MNALHTALTTQMTTGTLVAVDGQVLFDEENTTSVYHVLNGEVLILRNGQMVDLVQAGELLDASIWNGVTAVALTDCVLETVGVQPKVAFSYTDPAEINCQLYQSALTVN